MRVETAPCSESHPYLQQALSTPSAFVPSSRGLCPGPALLGGLRNCHPLLHSLDSGRDPSPPTTHTDLSDPLGLDLFSSHPWACSPPLREEVAWPKAPGPWGLELIQGASSRLSSYFCAWGASVPVAPLHPHPLKPSPDPCQVSASASGLGGVPGLWGCPSPASAPGHPGSGFVGALGRD